MATTAGINYCQQDACIIIDADLQHPIELIPQFLEKWEAGYEVVIGIRKKSKSDSWVKKIGSTIFYKLIGQIIDFQLVPNSTDFRLIDRAVIHEFNRFTEANRMTRALIDWLGFRRAYIYFDAKERLHGTASYSFWRLVQLAMNSFVSMSLMPLKIAGYLGIFITLISGTLGFYNLLGKYIFRTHLESFFYFSRTFSDAENLAILILFLVGIVLISIGLMALYIANIHSEVIKRPIYVVRKENIN
jgi:dolichol-phosphate mannosyltransferase